MYVCFFWIYVSRWFNCINTKMKVQLNSWNTLTAIVNIRERIKTVEFPVCIMCKKKTLNLLPDNEKWLKWWSHSSLEMRPVISQSTVIIPQYGMNIGNDMKWNFCYRLNEHWLWPLTPGWAFSSSQAENKEQRRLFFPSKITVQGLVCILLSSSVLSILEQD